MTAPTSFLFPSRVPISSPLSQLSHPLLITSETPTELVTFAITFARHAPSDGSLVIITSKDRVKLLSCLNSTVLTSYTSPVASTSSILASSRVTVYHVDSLAQLRVLLSSLQHSSVAFLGVDSFITLQEGGSELSAQGISRTLAAMVNIVSSSKGILVLGETRESVERSVPILNSGVSGISTHSTVPMHRILGRWVRGFWTQETNVDGDCSAEWICQAKRYHIRWTLDDGEIGDVQVSAS